MGNLDGEVEGTKHEESHEKNEHRFDARDSPHQDRRQLAGLEHLACKTYTSSRHLVDHVSKSVHLKDLQYTPWWFKPHRKMRILHRTPGYLSAPGISTPHLQPTDMKMHLRTNPLLPHIVDRLNDTRLLEN